MAEPTINAEPDLVPDEQVLLPIAEKDRETH